MAKKTVASLQKGEGPTFTKVIVMVKPPKTGGFLLFFLFCISFVVIIIAYIFHTVNTFFKFLKIFFTTLTTSGVSLCCHYITTPVLSCKYFFEVFKLIMEEQP